MLLALAVSLYLHGTTMYTVFSSHVSSEIRNASPLDPVGWIQSTGSNPLDAVDWIVAATRDAVAAASRRGDRCVADLGPGSAWLLFACPALAWLRYSRNSGGYGRRKKNVCIEFFEN